MKFGNNLMKILRLLRIILEVHVEIKKKDCLFEL